MKIFEESGAINTVLGEQRAKGLSIGFVPTMGALHEGHISLIQRAKQENDLVVCSIFVNPAQFNEQADLSNYPRMLDNDIQKLRESLCDILFNPTEQEIYPSPDNRKFDFEKLDLVMEGRYRPGHFQGVAKVVTRLFDIIGPDNAYFGEKDYQQLAIIRQLTRQLNYNINIIGCSTIREQDGLAKSSRNLLLSKKERKEAARIYSILTHAKKMAGNENLISLKEWVINEFKKYPNLKLEYFEIVNADTLQSVDHTVTSKTRIRAFVAAQLGKVRLIDNMELI